MTKIEIQIGSLLGIFQTSTIRVGSTLLMIAADQSGVHIDADASVLDGNRMERDTCLDVLLHLADDRTVYAWLDRRDPNHQQFAQAMSRWGGKCADNDGRFDRWEINH